jgi:hypothetical protein
MLFQALCSFLQLLWPHNRHNRPQSQTDNCFEISPKSAQNHPKIYQIISKLDENRPSIIDPKSSQNLTQITPRTARIGLIIASKIDPKIIIKPLYNCWGPTPTDGIHKPLCFQKVTNSPWF